MSPKIYPLASSIIMFLDLVRNVVKIKEISVCIKSSTMIATSLSLCKHTHYLFCLKLQLAGQ